MEIPLCKNLCDDITKFENFGFDKIKKSRYLENETFFFKRKTSLITHQGLLYCKK